MKLGVEWWLNNDRITTIRLPDDELTISFTQNEMWCLSSGIGAALIALQPWTQAAKN